MSSIARAPDVHGVCLNVDQLVFEADEPTAEAQRLQETITRIKKLGAYCTAVTSLSRIPADQALNKYGIEFDSIAPSIRTLRRTRAILASPAIWAYLATQEEDMEMASEHSKRAFGITANHEQASCLRLAGADTILPAIDAFPVWFSFTAEEPSELVSSQQFSHLTQLSHQALYEWTRTGHLPYTQDAYGRIKWPRAVAERLASQAKWTRPTLQDAHIYHLEWKTRFGNKADRQSATQELTTMRQENLLLITREVAALLGYSFDSIQRWSHIGFLTTIQQGPGLPIYYSANQVQRIHEILALPNSYDVAHDLGFSRATVNRYVRQGKLKAYTTPDGLRFNPRDIRAFMDEYQKVGTTVTELWRADRVSAELGISKSALKKWAAAGTLSYRAVNSRLHLYDAEEVRQLKETLQQLPSGFEWLLQRHGTYSVKQAATLLQVSDSMVLKLCDNDLLPFVNLAQPTALRKNIYLVREYVDGLKKFIGDVPVSSKTALVYKVRCGEQGHIV